MVQPAIFNLSAIAALLAFRPNDLNYGTQNGSFYRKYKMLPKKMANYTNFSGSIFIDFITNKQFLPTDHDSLC